MPNLTTPESQKFPEGLESALLEMFGEFEEVNDNMEEELTPVKIILYGDYIDWENFRGYSWPDMSPGKEKDFMRKLADFIILYKDTFFNMELEKNEQIIVDYVQKIFPRSPGQGIIQNKTPIDVMALLK